MYVVILRTLFNVFESKDFCWLLLIFFAEKIHISVNAYKNSLTFNVDDIFAIPSDCYSFRGFSFRESSVSIRILKGTI